jgi:SNF2 family DNA or RNA helicase
MTIHISHKTQSIVLPFEARLAALFPHGQMFEWNGGKVIVMPHGLDETRLLRNLDFQVPAPIAEHYAFPSADGRRPFGKQVLTSALMTMNQRCFVLNSMGTGKTKSCLWAFHWLKHAGKVRRMLVVAPLSTLNFTWEREIMATLPGLTVAVLTGDSKRRHKLLAEPRDIYIVNHHGVEVVYDALRKRPDIDVICFDEAAAYRNARAQRSRVARELALTRKYVWAMTGSPTPTAPTDAYGLAHLVIPDEAPRTFTGFRHETMVQVNQFKWVPRKDAPEIVARLLQPAVRYELDDIVELPPVIERDYEVELGPRQAAIYGALKEHASALLKEGTVTAANAGVVYSKLLQVSLGWVYGDKDREIFELDNGIRTKALIDLILSAEHKVLVFSPFRNATEGITKLLKKEKIDVAEVTGDVTLRERTEIFNAFQGTDKYRVINAHPECMSHGLTLTAADTIIWFGPVMKLETYEQANARIRRVGQLKKQQIIRMMSTPAERVAYRRLAQRQDLQDSVLDIIAELTTGDVK